MNLLLLEAHECTPAGEVMLTDNRARHVRSVLRATVGQQIRVGIVDGPVGTAAVQHVDPESVALRCVFEPRVPEPPPLDLLLALPRPKVMRRLWAQLAAVGVHRIMLTNAARVERAYFDTHVVSPECYRPLLLEGLQQAKDTRLPLVSVHRRFRPFVEDDLDALTGSGLRLAADPAASSSARSIGGLGPGARIVLAVGPEGGWNPFELALLEQHGFRRAGMGPRTLRTDTACIALLAVLHEALRAAEDAS